jgi:hypothetical protein
MRYIFGTIGIISALAFVGYAAVTSFFTAASMTSQFPVLAGAAASGLVAWESLGALFVQQCWRNRSRAMAVGGALLTLAASIYLLRIDLRFHVTGQSDMAASREVGIENRSLARSEYDKAVVRRDALQKVKTPNAFERSELAGAVKRIAELEPRLWSPETINAGAVPEAGWASRMLSGISSDRQWWTDVLMVVGLLFWALARMLALPVAVASMSMARSPQEARTAPKAVPVTERGTIIVPPALAPAVERHAQVESPVYVSIPSPSPASPPAVDSDPDRDPPPSGSRPDPAKPRLGELAKRERQPLAAPEPTPAARVATIHEIKPKAKQQPVKSGDPEKQTVLDWIGECITATHDRKRPPSSGDCHESLLAFCERERAAPVDQQRMTQIMTEILKPEKVKGRYPRNAKERIWPGWKVTMPAAERLRASA